MGSYKQMGPKNGGISDWDTGVVGPFSVGGWVQLRSVVTPERDFIGCILLLLFACSMVVQLL